MFLKLKNLNLPIVKIRKINANNLSTSAVPKEERIKIGNWNINYIKVGNGPHIVLCIPGALGSIWTDFKPQIEGFHREKFTLFASDLPGYGKSRPPERDFPTNYNEKDADFAYQFMKSLNLPKFSVLGWSDGAKSATIMAAKYPAAINKLVIWATNAFVLPHEMETYNKTKDIKTWSEKMRQPYIELYGEEYFSKLWAKWVQGMNDMVKANDGNICSHLLKDIKCQTLILYGEKDPMVDSVHASHLHTHIEGSKLHLYPDGKHNIHLRYPADFNKRVQEFLLLP